MAEGYISCSPEEFCTALGGFLEGFDSKIVAGVKTATEKTVKGMVTQTRASAPRRSGKYRLAITSEITHESPTGIAVTWGVSGRKGNLSHLLERGHATRGGGRTRAFAFIAPAQEAAEERLLDDIVKVVEDASR